MSLFHGEGPVMVNVSLSSSGLRPCEMSCFMSQRGCLVTVPFFPHLPNMSYSLICLYHWFNII